ncbi:hypothetical protein Pcinc_024485 [Petrolisthes cinctipes]|uniref:Uncharacterized protein n=1 Tax=Petrolisthes cinctipes TaxID=88211 RepID=A0AAE1FAU6_PETCI|nr:hypothetical protein Pcinc_024485 [Petrolisthes cinctipes]
MIDYSLLSLLHSAARGQLAKVKAGRAGSLPPAIDRVLLLPAAAATPAPVDAAFSCRFSRQARPTAAQLQAIPYHVVLAYNYIRALTSSPSPVIRVYQVYCEAHNKRLLCYPASLSIPQIITYLVTKARRDREDDDTSSSSEQDDDNTSSSSEQDDDTSSEEDEVVGQEDFDDNFDYFLPDNNNDDDLVKMITEDDLHLSQDHQEDLSEGDHEDHSEGDQEDLSEGHLSEDHQDLSESEQQDLSEDHLDFSEGHQEDLSEDYQDLSEGEQQDLSAEDHHHLLPETTDEQIFPDMPILKKREDPLLFHPKNPIFEREDPLLFPSNPTSLKDAKEIGICHVTEGRKRWDVTVCEV